MNEQQMNLDASQEQLAYARLLKKCVIFGFAILIVCFALYVFGIVGPSVPLDQIGEYWSLPLDKYLRKTNYDAGWSWTAMLRYGDCLNFIPLAVFGTIAMICYLRIIPILKKNRNFAYLAIAIAQILVLLLAASNLLKTG
ncbi:MAG TPA: hypothetical protein ENH94_02725 [Phycisphaerales bacterium]|nr:hypothetical protein [Phycisphaerales bacterium]